MAEADSTAFDDWVTTVLQVDPRSYQSAGESPSGGGVLDSVAHALGTAKDAVVNAAETVGKTVATAATTVEHAVVDTAETVAHTVADGLSSAGKAVKEAFTGPPPLKQMQCGPAQTARADKLLKAMPPADQEKVKAVLDKAKPAEKGYIEKALASKHSASEIEAFYAKIAGKDEAWLNENLHVVGQSHGKGIKQQWSDSCGPTTVQAMKAELDPIYALQLRTDNPDFEEADDTDGTKKNKAMADEQKAILEKFGGNAQSRDDPQGLGAGMALDGALADQKATTGLKFDCEAVNDSDVDARLTEIDTSIANGMPVPMRVSAGGANGHFVLCTSVEPGPPRRYAISDPWDGKVVFVTDKQIKDKDFKVAGWSQLSHIYKPSADPSADAP